MASKTKNYNLTKPAQDDYYDVGVFNENADTVDGIMKAISNDVSDNMNRLDELEGTVSNIKSRLGESGYLYIGNLLVQWGITTCEYSGASTFYVEYPIAFSEVYNVQATKVDNSDYTYDFILPTKEGLQIAATQLVGTASFTLNWLAIGKK